MRPTSLIENTNPPTKKKVTLVLLPSLPPPPTLSIVSLSDCTDLLFDDKPNKQKVRSDLGMR